MAIDVSWWKEAVLYELYVRAFRDANGDGHGDLRGVCERLDYLRDLGVDVLWLLPLSPSPLRDDGYDVSDYLGIHPDYGTLDDFGTLLDAAPTRADSR
jgi:maltose alpha-D-glucosyltransferase / alpha-amylase